MKNINVPSYNSLLSKDKIIKSILYLYDYIKSWKKETDEHKDTSNLSAIMSLSTDASSGVTIDTTIPEYKVSWVDSQSNVLIGKKQDNSWYYADDLDTILDTIISNL